MGKASQALIELMLTIAPWRCASMCRPTAWEQRNTPVCITPIEASQSASENVSEGPARPIPALLTSTSTRPWASTTAATAASTDARELTSHW